MRYVEKQIVMGYISCRRTLVISFRLFIRTTGVPIGVIGWGFVRYTLPSMALPDYFS